MILLFLLIHSTFSYDCDHHCNQIIDTCSGVHTVYSDIKVGGTTVINALTLCKGLCDMWPIGEPDDYGKRGTPPTSGASLACRQNYLDLINPDDESTYIYCAYAAPMGGQGIDNITDGVCGDFAHFYCDVATSPQLQQQCTDVLSLGYSSYNECLQESTIWPLNGTGNFSYPVASGNNVECRTTMAANSGSPLAPISKEQGCPAALWHGGGICGTACENFCDDFGITCGFGPDLSTQYLDKETCLSQCVTWKQIVDTNHTHWNSVGCRKSRLMAARAAPDTLAIECINALANSTICTSVALALKPAFLLLALLISVTLLL